MFGKHFDLNEQTIPVIEEIGRHMPGGFFIYKAEGDEELLYANQPVLDIYGCENLEEFKELTGYTFKGMVHPDDYDVISASIIEQIEGSDENMDYAEYRIIRKDGKVRWVDDYGHYADSNNYGGLYYVFISDITERREKREQEQDVKDAVIDSLTTAYNTVFLINDVETGRSDLEIGVFLPRLLEKFVVDIQLKDIALFQPGIPLGPGVVQLDPLDADILLGQRGRQQRHRLGQKPVQPLTGVVFLDLEFFHCVHL